MGSFRLTFLVSAAAAAEGCEGWLAEAGAGLVAATWNKDQLQAVGKSEAQDPERELLQRHTNRKSKKHLTGFEPMTSS